MAFKPSKKKADQKGEARARPERKPRPVTLEYLERAALHYLGRFAATEARLAEVLENKIRRRTMDSETPTEEHRVWIADVVAKCVRLGYVNDDEYARQRAASLHRRGKNRNTIQRDLVFRGVSEQAANAQLADMYEENPDADWQALLNFARRRRFGPFKSITGKEKPAEKQIAAIMRAGFRYQDAKKIVEAETAQELSENYDNF